MSKPVEHLIERGRHGQEPIHAHNLPFWATAHPFVAAAAPCDAKPKWPL
jgi:hypothetical protein